MVSVADPRPKLMKAHSAADLIVAGTVLGTAIGGVIGTALGDHLPGLFFGADIGWGVGAILHVVRHYRF
jgi:hypothetical protein